MPKINDNTNITLPVRNLLAIVVITGLAVTAYVEIQNSLTHLGFQQEVIWTKVRESEEFITTFDPKKAVEYHIAKQHKLEILLNNVITRLEQLEEQRN